MSSRKQRTKQFNNLTFERIDMLFEISETQSIVRIFIQFIFESESSLSQFITESMTNVQNIVFFLENININLIDDADQNDFIEQMKLKLTIIEIEKRRLYLRHKLVQMKTKRKTDFFVTTFAISKLSRENVEL